MSIKPILFSAPMVRALLEGRKTQTRRMLKTTKRGAECIVWLEFPGGREFYNGCADGSHVWSDGNEYPIAMSYAPGDLLWVKESWAVGVCADGLKPSELSPSCWLISNGGLWLEGQDPASPISARGKLRPSLFMPRLASRLTLEVTGVKVERLQDITASDAKAEGVKIPADVYVGGSYGDVMIHEYEALWNTINTKPGTRWADNPWIVAVTFTVHKINVDAYLAQQKDAAA